MSGQVYKNRRNDRSVKSLMSVGLIILLLCVAICVTMIISVTTTYRADIIGEFQTRNEIEASVFSRFLMEEGRAAKNAAALLSQYPVDQSRIVDAENYGRGYNEYSHIGFIDTNGEVFLDGRAYSGGPQEYLFSYFETITYGRDMLHICTAPAAVKQMTVCDVVAVSPVLYGSSIQGYVFVPINADALLTMDVFREHQKSADMYLVDKEGYILAGNNQTYLDQSVVSLPGRRFRIQDLVLKIGKARDISMRVRSITRGLSDGVSGYLMVETEEGYVMQVSYAPIADADRLYLVSCYNSDLVEERMKPLLFRSTLACLLVSILMIASTIYVWETSRRANMTAERLAYNDPVTGGYNVNYFNEFAEHVMHNNKELPFVINRFDISNFRYINEAYGHTRADALLSSCIEQFGVCFGEKELCVRMDADQFLALMVNDAGLDGRIEAYRAAVNADARGQGIKYPIRFKSGIYKVRKHERDIAVMIDHANAARKMLKGDKKNNSKVYSEEIIAGMHRVDQIESQMQRALADGEFKVYLQPKWDIINDRVAGAEALVRWIKPDGKIIPPDEFIPLFENNGFIEKLDFYMLEEVCRYTKDLVKQGKMAYPVSVNQSRVLLHNPDYLDNVEDILKKYKIEGNMVELEITETVFEEDEDYVKDVLKKLKESGVTLNMDDFGSGYSSLNMLKEAPFDIVKLDREFFSKSVDDEKSRLILTKIVEMIHVIGMGVICEGVETKEQVEFLKGLGVKQVQGFYYSKPIPCEEFRSKYCE